MALLSTEFDKNFRSREWISLINGGDLRAVLLQGTLFGAFFLGYSLVSLDFMWCTSRDVTESSTVLHGEDHHRYSRAFVCEIL